ncbi:MAG: DUF4124 domain-containing protein [Methylophagaceae bacterium]
MTIFKYSYLLLALLFSTISLPINAGQLYRFLDKDGVITVSKSLPPYAAQKGYDILDDTSLYLIKRVEPALTSAQIAEQEQQQAQQKAELEEAQRLADIEKQQQRRQRRQQAAYDQALLASYQSEQELLKVRADDILYRQTQLTRATEQLTKNEQKLHNLQQQAAEQELSGSTISVNLKKRLARAQKNIDLQQTEIEHIQLDEQKIRIRYKEELIRLKQLLSKK